MATLHTYGPLHGVTISFPAHVVLAPEWDVVTL